MPHSLPDGASVGASAPASTCISGFAAFTAR